MSDRHTVAIWTSGYAASDPDSIGKIEFECGKPHCMTVTASVYPSVRIPEVVASMVRLHEEAIK